MHLLEGKIRRSQTKIIFKLNVNRIDFFKMIILGEE